jgi:OPA family glycerol-3-phosphate transporter-like MFS transporter
MKTWSRKTVVLFALFAAYASFYLCRANVDASLPLLAMEYGYDKEQLGRLSSIAIAGYAVGKVTLGPLGDVVGGRRLILLAVLGSVVACLGFGLSSSLAVLATFAAVNRWFQSAGWAGVVHVSVREFAKERHGTFMGGVSTSYEVGNVVTLLLCGLLVRWGLGWRALFVVNPILFLAIGLATTKVLERATARDVETAAPIVSAPRESVAGRVAWLAGRRSFWIALGLSFLLTFVRMGFLTWTPTFLVELAAQRGETASGAILKSAVFPAMGVAGALLAGRASDRFGPGRRAPVIAASLVVVVVAVLLIAHGGFTGTAPILVLIAVSGLFLLGPYSLVGGVTALDVGTARASSTAAGLIDAAGYVGASLVGVVLGTLAQRRGWPAAFDALAFVTLAAAVVAAAWGISTAARAVPSKEAA